MRKTIMLALAAAGLAGAGLGVATIPAGAQGAPPSAAPGMEGRGPGMHRPMGPMMGGMPRGPMEEGMHHMRDHGDDHEGDHGGGGMMHRMRAFSLIYPAADRALSGADVQKIAEAFLLFNGNHSWKVTEVTEEPNRVTFAFATADGTAIAHFAMDRHTARPERLS